MLFLCIYKKENIREINWIRYFQSSLRILFFVIYLRLRIFNGHVSSHTYNLSWRFLRKSFFTIYPVILLLRLYCLISPESDNGIFLDKTGIPISSPKWSLKYLSIESSVQFSSVHLLNRVSLQRHGLQHTSPPCPSPNPGAYSNSCPLSQWCHPTISSAVTPLSSCPQSLPASGSFPMSWLFTSGGQSIGAWASASVLPMTLRTDLL